jgi:hypothetical protein
MQLGVSQPRLLDSNIIGRSLNATVPSLVLAVTYRGPAIDRLHVCPS